MRILKTFLLLVFAFTLSNLTAQTVVKMDLPEQADEQLKVVALFNEEIPEGIPVVLGIMGYSVVGGSTPYLFEWLLNEVVISTTDIAIFTPTLGDLLSLKITDNNKCRSTTSFNLKIARIPSSLDENIEVYPTLVSNYIHIKLPLADKKLGLLRIFSIDGKIVLEQSISESTNVDLKLIPGIYFVSVRIGDIHKIEKIIAK